MDMIMRRPGGSSGRCVRRIRRVVEKYVAVLRVSVASNLAYVVEVLLRTVVMGVMVFIISQLWKTTFASRHAQAFGGFTMNAVIWYLLAAEIVAMSLPDLASHIDQEVRSGQLAYLLGRPCNYILYHFAQYLGERLVRLTINLLVGSLLGLLIIGVPQLSWQGIVAWPLTVFLALCIDFVAYCSIGLLAFWTEETRPFSFVFSRLTLVLGGVLIPLDLLPQPLQSIAQALPFSMILYGPARTLVHFDANSFGRLIVQQGLTLMVGIGILLWVYRVALRRVHINGG